MRTQVLMTCSSDAGAAQHILDPLLAAGEGELPSLRPLTPQAIRPRSRCPCADKYSFTCSRNAGAAQHILDPLLAAVEGELPSLRRSGAAGASGGHLSKVGIRVLGLQFQVPRLAGDSRGQAFCRLTRNRRLEDALNAYEGLFPCAKQALAGLFANAECPHLKQPCA